MTVDHSESVFTVDARILGSDENRRVIRMSRHEPGADPQHEYDVTPFLRRVVHALAVEPDPPDGVEDPHADWGQQLYLATSRNPNAPAAADEFNVYRLTPNGSVDWATAASPFSSFGASAAQTGLAVDVNFDAETVVPTVYASCTAFNSNDLERLTKINGTTGQIITKFSGAENNSGYAKLAVHRAHESSAELYGIGHGMEAGDTGVRQWLYKIDTTNGTIIWKRQVEDPDTNDPAYIHDLSVSNDGVVHLFGAPSPGSLSNIAWRYAANGDLLFSRHFNSPGGVSGQADTIATSQGRVVFGYRPSSHVARLRAYPDDWTAEEGHLLWERNVNTQGLADISHHEVACDGDGFVYSGASLNIFPGDSTPTDGLRRRNIDGGPVWQVLNGAGGINAFPIVTYPPRFGEAPTDTFVVEPGTWVFPLEGPPLHQQYNENFDTGELSLEGPAVTLALHSALDTGVLTLTGPDITWRFRPPIGGSGIAFLFGVDTGTLTLESVDVQLRITPEFNPVLQTRHMAAIHTYRGRRTHTDDE